MSVTMDVASNFTLSLLFYWSGAQGIFFFLPLRREDAILETPRLVSRQFACDF